MRKRTRIGVVTAALLLGLVAPSVTGVARGDQVVAAGVTHGIDDLVKGAVRAAIRFFGGTTVDEAAVRAATRQLDQKVPAFVRTPLGDFVVPDQRQRWQLIHVACRAQDVLEFQRQTEVRNQLVLLGEELPGAVGYGLSIYSLANELANTKKFGDQTRKAAGAALCMSAERVLKQPL